MAGRFPINSNDLLGATTAATATTAMAFYAAAQQ